jgi:hypothetical protein
MNDKPSLPAEIAAAFWLVVFFAVMLGPMPIALEAMVGHP